MSTAIPPATAKMERDPAQKALTVLSFLMDHGADEWGVRELGVELSITPSTTHRALAILNKAGYVERTDGGRYRLGLELYRLARLAAASFPVERIALPSMRALERRISESVYLMIYDQTRKQVIIPTKVECSHPIRHVVDIMAWQDVWDSASGLAVFAFLDDDEQLELMRSSSKHIKHLSKFIAETRERGYSLFHPPGVDDAWVIAVPIRDGRGVLGVISVPIPVSRFMDGDESSVPREIMACADAISDHLSSARG